MLLLLPIWLFVQPDPRFAYSWMSSLISRDFKSQLPPEMDLGIKEKNKTLWLVIMMCFLLLILIRVSPLSLLLQVFSVLFPYLSTLSLLLHTHAHTHVCVYVCVCAVFLFVNGRKWTMPWSNVLNRFVPSRAPWAGKKRVAGAEIRAGVSRANLCRNSLSLAPELNLTQLWSRLVSCTYSWTCIFFSFLFIQEEEWASSMRASWSRSAVIIITLAVVFEAGLDGQEEIAGEGDTRPLPAAGLF